MGWTQLAISASLAWVTHVIGVMVAYWGWVVQDGLVHMAGGWLGHLSSPHGFFSSRTAQVSYLVVVAAFQEDNPQCTASASITVANAQLAKAKYVHKPRFNVEIAI